MGSAHYIAAAFEQMFDEKQPENLKQVTNGISYITEDFTLAKFLIDTGYPDDFTEAMNADPNAPEHCKFISSNLSSHFLYYYKEVFEK